MSEVLEIHDDGSYALIYTTASQLEDVIHDLLHKIAQLEAKVDAVRAFDIKPDASALTLGEAIMELQSRNHQLEAELKDRCATIDAIEDGKTVDYYVVAQQETNRMLLEEREKNRQLEAENERLRELLQRLKSFVESDHVKVMAEDLPFQIGIGDLFQEMEDALKAGEE